MERLYNSQYETLSKLKTERIQNEIIDLQTKQFIVDSESVPNTIFAYNDTDIFRFDLTTDFPFEAPIFIKNDMQQDMEWNEFSSLHDLIYKSNSGVIETKGEIERKTIQENNFTLYITASAYFVKKGNIDQKYLILINNIITTIENNGYTNIIIHGFDQNLEQHSGLYNRIFTNITLYNRFLQYEDLIQFQNKDNFLLVDCAHITFYRLGSETLHNDYKVRLNISQYFSKTSNELVINSVYPSYLNDLTTEFITNFEFIRFNDKKIITFIWSILNKRIKFRIKNIKNDSIDTVIDYNGTEGVMLHFTPLINTYSTDFINTLIWA